jgi:cephalosporin hydroxylase
MPPSLPPRPEPVPGDYYTPTGWRRVFLRPSVGRAISGLFARLYYARVADTVFGSSWLGYQTLKYPTDMWAYQEIIAETMPDLIVETGTWQGGSALFFAGVCDGLGHGRIVSVDIEPQEPLPRHERVEFVRGSSTDPEIVAGIAERAAGAESVLVILDSAHERDHVLAELEAYAPLVTPGGYLIVEDTNVNGHPVLPEHGPGPGEAVAAFLASDDRFEADASRERLLITACPGGFLRRRAG